MVRIGFVMLVKLQHTFLAHGCTASAPESWDSAMHGEDGAAMRAYLHSRKIPSFAFCWESSMFSSVPSISRTEACTCTSACARCIA